MSRGRLLSALWAGLLGAGACNNTFPTVSGAGGYLGARGGSSGRAGASGIAGSPGTRVDAGSGPVLDGGSPPVDAGPLPHCATVAPTGPVIANFDNSNNAAFGVYGVDPVVGSTIVSTGTLVEDFTEGNWHLAGSITDTVTFGFYWKCPGVIDGICTLDLTRYAGVQFTVNGDFGPSSILDFSMGSIQDDAPTPYGCGVCGGLAVGACSDPYVIFSLDSAAMPEMLTVPWNSLQAGNPAPYYDGRVSSITWTLPAAPAGSSYPVDFTIDDVRLIPIPH